jgi:hypothetical protein
MVTYLKPLLSKAEWCRYCIHLKILNFNHFKIDAAMGLKVIAPRSPTIASSSSVAFNGPCRILAFLFGFLNLIRHAVGLL